MAMEILRDIINLLISAILSIIVAYFTATYAVRREMKHGKARFLWITQPLAAGMLEQHAKHKV
jgi:hypothetical protein